MVDIILHVFPLIMYIIYYRIMSSLIERKIKDKIINN